MSTQKTRGELFRGIRKMRGLSAEALAGLIGDPTLTRDTIANVESGRKADLTLAQAVNVADALGVSVLALVIDYSDPWDDFPAPRGRRLNAVELALEWGRRASSLFGHNETELVVALQQCEENLTLLRGMERLLENPEEIHPGQTDFLTSALGTDVYLTHYFCNDDELWRVASRAVRHYREALFAVRILNGSTPGNQPYARSKRISESLIRCRAEVVALLEVYDVEHGEGQTENELSELIDLPPLDPRSGRYRRPDVVERWFDD